MKNNEMDTLQGNRNIKSQSEKDWEPIFSIFI